MNLRKTPLSEALEDLRDVLYKQWRDALINLMNDQIPDDHYTGLDGLRRLQHELGQSPVRPEMHAAQMTLDPNPKLSFERTYLHILYQILTSGFQKEDRTGTGTTGLFGAMMRADLRGGQVALLTSKEVNYEVPIHETLWFLSGSTDVRYLKDQGISIWDDWVIPSTAVFAPALAGYEPTGLDMLTWLRCHQPEVYALWKAFKAEHRIGQPKRKDAKAFCDSVGVPYPNQRLVSGSIGKGAYGTAWRNWEDTKIVLASDAQTYYDRGYRYICDVPTGSNFDKQPGQPQQEFVVVYRKIDQVANAIKLLKDNADSRRIIVSGWNAAMIEDAALPPCHTLFQFLSRPLDNAERNVLAGLDEANWETERQLNSRAIPKRALTLMLYCRSQDVAVGTPFNLFQYSLLAHLVAFFTDHEAEELVWVGADVHLYNDQRTLAEEQTTRRPYEQNACIDLSRLAHDHYGGDVKSIDDVKFEHLEIVGYEKFHPRINYPVSV